MTEELDRAAELYRKGFQDGLDAAAEHVEQIGSYGWEIMVGDINNVEPNPYILSDAIAAATLAETGWRDIKGAPKDRLIDIFIASGSLGVRWCDVYYDEICDEWRTASPGGKVVWISARHVTHWRERPAPPPKPETAP